MRRLALVVAVACFTATPARADVRLSIHDGRVSLTARDATLRQILAEWARVGQTRIVNLDRVPGGPVTLELADVPESRALDIVLRSLSGYLAAPRPTMLTNASRYDRIVVMPTTAAPRSATATVPAPPLSQPRFYSGNGEDQQDEDPARMAAPSNVQPGVVIRPPVFNTFPAPENTQPPQPTGGPAAAQAPPVPTMTNMPTAPPGVALPGVIVQPPSQPNSQTPSSSPPPQRP